MSDHQGHGLEPADNPAVNRMRARARVIAAQRKRGTPMPFNPRRPQSGMYDSHGDGHPPRETFLAHTRCEPLAASEGPAEGTEDTGSPEVPEGPQPGA